MTSDLLDILITKRVNLANHCWVERWLDTEMSAERFIQGMNFTKKEIEELARRKIK